MFRMVLVEIDRAKFPIYVLEVSNYTPSISHTEQQEKSDSDGTRVLNICRFLVLGRLNMKIPLKNSSNFEKWENQKEWF